MLDNIRVRINELVQQREALVKETPKVMADFDARIKKLSQEQSEYAYNHNRQLGLIDGGIEELKKLLASLEPSATEPGGGRVGD